MDDKAISLEQMKLILSAVTNKIDKLENRINYIEKVNDYIIYGDVITNINSLTVNSNDIKTFTIKLSSAPSKNQMVILTLENNYINIDKSSLIFTPDNYNVPQVITVSTNNTEYTSKKTNIIISSGNISPKIVSVTSISINNENDFIILNEQADRTGKIPSDEYILEDIYTALDLNKILVIPEGDYLITRTIDLKKCRNIHIHFEPGSKFIRNVIERPYAVLYPSFPVINLCSDNITITGVLTVDGQGDKSPIVDNSSCEIGIFGCKNLYIEKINVYNSYGDGIDINSDIIHSTIPHLTSGHIKSIYSEKSGRKNLLIGYANNITIDEIILDNTSGNRNYTGGHCLGIEPSLSAYGSDYYYPDGEVETIYDRFNERVNVLPLNINIGYLKTTGTGNDFMPGTSKYTHNFKLNIDNFECEIVGSNTTVNKYNRNPYVYDIDGSHEYHTAIKCFGIDLNIKNMELTMDTVGHPTWEGSRISPSGSGGNGGETKYFTEQYPSLIIAWHAAKVTIDNLNIIKGGNPNGNLIMMAQGRYSSPSLTINSLSGNCSCGSLILKDNFVANDGTRTTCVIKNNTLNLK